MLSKTKTFENVNIYKYYRITVKMLFKFLIGHCAMYDTTAGIVQNDDNTLFKGTLENCTYRSNTFHGKNTKPNGKDAKMI